MQTNAVIQRLNVLVFGRTGIVYSESDPEANEKTSYNITFKITEDMAPEADLVVYYTRDQDGEIIHDQLRLQFSFKANNTVS